MSAMITETEIEQLIIRAMEHWRPRATGSFVLSADGQYVMADAACWGVEVDGSASVLRLTPVDRETREVRGQPFPIPIPAMPLPPPPESPLAQVVALGERCQGLLAAGQKSFAAWQRHTSGVGEGTVVITADYNLLAVIGEVIAAHQQSTQIAEVGPTLVADTLRAVHTMRASLMMAARGHRNFALAGEWQEAPRDQQHLHRVEQQANKLQRALDETLRPALSELTEKTPRLLLAVLRELRDRACTRYRAETTRARHRLQAERAAIECEDGEGLAAIRAFGPALTTTGATLTWSEDLLAPPTWG